MQSNISSGFSSLTSLEDARTPCSSMQLRYKLDTESVNSKLKHENEIAKLKSVEPATQKRVVERIQYENAVTELTVDGRMYNKAEPEHEFNDVCPYNRCECKKKIATLQIKERELEDSKRLNTELLEELGRVETELRMRVNEEKDVTRFQNIYFPKRKMAESEKPNVLKSDKVCFAEFSASTERPTDKLETLTSNDENVDDVSLGSPGNETYSDHLQSENISPGQDEDSSNKASRMPSFIPDSGPAAEETHTASPPLLEKDNSFRDQKKCYKKILKIIQQNLLSQDVLKFKEWACEKLPIDGFKDVADVLACLEQEGIIGASNLSELRSFFESITKFDFVHVIDLFLQGDTTVLQKYNLRESESPDVPERVGPNTTLMDHGADDFSAVLQPTTE